MLSSTEFQFGPIVHGLFQNKKIGIVHFNINRYLPTYIYFYMKIFFCDINKHLE